MTFNQFVIDVQAKQARYITTEFSRMDALDAARAELRCGTPAYKIKARELGFHPLRADEINARRVQLRRMMRDLPKTHGADALQLFYDMLPEAERAEPAQPADEGNADGEAEQAHQADAMAATLEAIRAILLADAHDPRDDFGADDSGAQVHVLPCENGQCDACPFSTTPEAEQALNWGCLPDRHEVFDLVAITGRPWGCHSDEMRVCCGYKSAAKAKGLPVTGSPLSYSAWYRGDYVAMVPPSLGDVLGRLAMQIGS